MKKIIISLLLTLSLFGSSCASVRVNGIEINSEKKVETKTEDILAWTTLITVCGIMYVGLPIVVMGNLKQY